MKLIKIWFLFTILLSSTLFLSCDLNMMGGVSPDLPSLNSRYGNAVQMAQNGGYIIVGSAYLNSSSPVVYLLKTNNQGDEQWSKAIAGPIYGEGYDINGTYDGGYIITGWFTGSSLGLLKTDIYGNTEWCESFIGNGNSYGYRVSCTTNGYIIAVGATGFTAGYTGNVYLIKTTWQGDLVWSNIINCGGNDYAQDLLITANGSCIIAGYSVSPELDFTPFLVKTDNQGNKQWQQNFADGVISSVQFAPDGGYILAGYTPSQTYEINDIYLIKTDSEGNQQWQRTPGSGFDELGKCVLVTSNGDYIIMGKGSSNSILLIKTDSQGNEIWEKYYGGEGIYNGCDLQLTSDGGYIITGWAQQIADENGLMTEPMIYLLKTDSEGNEIWAKTYGG
jgi:hypothetical protein